MESVRRRLRKKSRERRKRIIIILIILVVIAALIPLAVTLRNSNGGSRHDSRGLASYQDGDYETAIAEFKEAISYDSQNADYYDHLGMAYIELKSYDEARGYFNQADACARTNDQKVRISRDRGIACMYQGNYDGARTAFDRALSMDFKDEGLKKDILYYLAETNRRSGDAEGAAGVLSTLIGMEDDASVRVERGMIYESLENYSAAEEDFSAAIKMNKKNYTVYMHLYDVLMAQRRIEDAQGVLTEALSLSGSSGSDLFIKGMIYLNLEDTEKAGEMLEAALNKGYKAALLGQAQMAADAEDDQAALGLYQQYFSEADLSGEDPELLAKAYNQYTVCLMAAGDYEAALDNCRKGLALDARQVDSALSMNEITALEHLGRWDEAFQAAKSFITRYPEDEAGLEEYRFLESRAAY